MSNIVVNRIENVIKDAEHAPDSGVRDHELLIPCGSYMRRTPRYINLDHSVSPALEQAVEQRSPASQTYGNIYRTEFSDAFVCGQGALITANNILIEESSIEYLAQKQVPPGMVDNMSGNLSLRYACTKYIDEPALLIKRPSWLNYGHWLIEGATILSLLSAYIQRYKPVLILGSYTKESKSMKRIVDETIDIICPGVSILEHPDDETWSFKNINYVTPLHCPPICKVPISLEKLRTFVLQRTRFERAGKRRIYLSRSDQSTRRLENEKDIIFILQKYGFETVYLSGMSLIEQAGLFSQCEAVFGIKGAALANILFCRPNCKVMILSPSNWPDPFFYDIANQMDLVYGELFCEITNGPVAGHHDFIARTEEVIEMLERVL